MVNNSSKLARLLASNPDAHEALIGILAEHGAEYGAPAPEFELTRNQGKWRVEVLKINGPHGIPMEWCANPHRDSRAGSRGHGWWYAN